MRSEIPRATLTFDEHKDHVYKLGRITRQMVTSKKDGEGEEQMRVWESGKIEGEGQRLVIGTRERGMSEQDGMCRD